MYVMEETCAILLIVRILSQEREGYNKITLGIIIIVLLVSAPLLSIWALVITSVQPQGIISVVQLIPYSLFVMATFGVAILPATIVVSRIANVDANRLAHLLLVSLLCVLVSLAAWVSFQQLLDFIRN